MDVVPFPDKLAFACHSELQTKHGIYNHENLVFDGLIADKKYQFRCTSSRRCQSRVRPARRVARSPSPECSSPS